MRGSERVDLTTVTIPDFVGVWRLRPLGRDKSIMDISTIVIFNLMPSSIWNCAPLGTNPIYYTILGLTLMLIEL